MAKVEVLIKGLEKKLDEKFGAIDKRFDGIDKRFEIFEERMTMGFSEIRGTIKDFYAEFTDFKSLSMDRFDDLYKKIDTLKHDEYYSLVGGLKRVEDEHRIIDHATILKEITALKAAKQS